MSVFQNTVEISNARSDEKVYEKFPCMNFDKLKMIFVLDHTSAHRSCIMQPAACRSGSECPFYDGQDRKIEGSTTISLLCPRIRCFTITIPARRNATSCK